jgi:hypothetical protein
MVATLRTHADNCGENITRRKSCVCAWHVRLGDDHTLSWRGKRLGVQGKKSVRGFVGRTWKSSGELMARTGCTFADATLPEPVPRAAIPSGLQPRRSSTMLMSRSALLLISHGGHFDME